MDTLFPKVLQAVAGEDFTVYLYFNDGSVRLYDAKPLLKLGGVFAPLQDEAFFKSRLPALTLPLLIPTGVFAALLGAAAVGWHREGVWQQQGQLLLCRQHRFHLHQLCVFHPDTGFTALQSPWAVTVQRANLTLVFPGKEKVTVRSVPLAALDFLEI